MADRNQTVKNKRGPPKDCRIIILKAYRKWTKTPNNTSRRKAFLDTALGQFALNPFGLLMVLFGMDDIHEIYRTRHTMDIFPQVIHFLLSNLTSNTQYERDIVSMILDFVVHYCAKSLERRFQIMRQGVLKRILHREYRMLNPESFAQIISLFKEKHTKNRLMEMSETDIRIQDEIRFHVMPSSEKWVCLLEKYKFENHPTCLNCNNEEPEGVLFLKCGRCRMAFLCSERCQRECWSSHRKVCKAILE
jgi:hypothetical protein